MRISQENLDNLRCRVVEARICRHTTGSAFAFGDSHTRPDLLQTHFSKSINIFRVASRGKAENCMYTCLPKIMGSIRWLSAACTSQQLSEFRLRSGQENPLNGFGQKLRRASHWQAPAGFHQTQASHPWYHTTLFGLLYSLHCRAPAPGASSCTAESAVEAELLRCKSMLQVNGSPVVTPLDGVLLWKFEGSGRLCACEG